jgi:DNA repair protein RecO (recombination protein O)
MTPSTRRRLLSGVVLHVRNFGEGHRVVEALTAEEGRVAAVARHARSSRKRFAGALDLFASLELELTPRPGLWGLEAATLHGARLGLRDDLDRLEGASLCCEAVRLLVPEHQAAPGPFADLGAALDRLDAGDLRAPGDFLRALLTAAGVAPDLEHCVACGRKPESVAAVDPVRGGVVCSACAPRRLPLPAEAVVALGGAPSPDLATAARVEAFAVDWIEVQTGRRLRSRGGSGRGEPTRR